MIQLRAAVGRFKKRRVSWLLALGAVVVAGCQTASYYRQAIAGQFQIVTHRQPLPELIADTNTAAALRDKFQLVLRLRQFAERELRLPVNGHYERYVDVHRRFVVWNVYAAPELSLKHKSWWYPVVGRLEYRGYFSEPLARRYAARLKQKGWDVYVGGVEAYSTLGWFKDPVLNTFIHHDEPDLAEILFHELAHQRIFFSSDTDFNEAFATAVAEEGTRRWLIQSGDAAARAAHEAGRRRHEEFVQLVMSAREKLKPVYGDTDKEAQAAARDNMSNDFSDEEKRRAKARILGELRRDYEACKARWGGHCEYDNWFSKPINNARLNTVATYYDLVPGFHRRLQANGGDLEKFYSEVQGWKRLSKEERRRRLSP